MFIDLDVSEGEWFPFFGSHIDQSTGDIVYHDPEPDARVQIRSTAPFIELKLKNRKRCTENVFNPKTRGMERVTYFKEQTVEELMAELDEMYDYAITGVEGFKDKRTGDVIKCTKENKALLRHNEVFNRFFERCQQMLHGSVIKEKEDAEKNYLNPQDGQ